MKNFFAIFFVVAFVGCKNFIPEVGIFGNNRDRGEISIATWNVQTFFDAIEDGYEFADFKGSKTPWSAEKYEQRLKNISRQLQLIKADIIALQEVENEFVMKDILAFLGSSSSLKYAGFARQDSSSVFGNGIFSRYPIKSLKTHQINVDFADLGKPPAMRPLVEVEIQYGSEDEILVVFICHWKSKSGGSEKTEIWRKQQQSLLISVIEQRQRMQPTLPIIVLGDFNTDINDFNFSEGMVLLSNEEIQKSFFTAWPAYQLDNDIGTYYYQGSWEAIDHIFLLHDSEQSNYLENFKVHYEEDFANEDKTPYRYNVWSGNGSSDHLPISASVILNKS
ncbi:MAG: endonuclease/exonuclease/phosphatase family protein [Treponemataceae bacterium]